MSANRPHPQSMGFHSAAGHNRNTDSSLAANPSLPPSQSSCHATAPNYPPARSGPKLSTAASAPCPPAQQPYPEQWGEPESGDYSGNEDEEGYQQCNKSSPQWNPPPPNPCQGEVSEGWQPPRNRVPCPNTYYDSPDEIDDDVSSIEPNGADCFEDQIHSFHTNVQGLLIFGALLLMLGVFGCILYFIAEVSILTLMHGCGWYLIPFFLLLYLFAIPYLCSC